MKGKYLTAFLPEHLDAASHLFREYADGLGIDLCFQDFDKELLLLDEMYGPENGGIILYKTDKGFVACVGLRRIDKDVAELKRMYVKPEFRGEGIGKHLLQLALELAHEKGYKKVRLDTLSVMTPAINLYKKTGFREINPYYYNPESTAVFFELDI